MSKEQETKIRTGLVRFSYPNVFTPKKIGDKGDPKYSISLIIPKEDEATIAKIRAGIEAAVKSDKGKKIWGDKPPKANPKMNPLKDGDVEKPDDEAYANCYYLSCNSATKPGILGPDKLPIGDPENFYAGCKGYAVINFFAFNKDVNKGIGVGLNNLMKVEDGERLGGKDTAENDFADVEASDDLL